MDIAMEQVIRKAQTLIEALPYMQKLHGATIVIKYGGAAMANAELMDAVMDDVILLKCIGLNPILVHGGGPEISRELAGMGVPTRFVNGLRVTDERTMEVVQMALVGKTNKGIVSILNRKGAKAIGLCGVDGGLLECEKLEMEVDGEPVDLGYVGKVTKVDCKALDLIAKDAYIPVVAPIGAGKDGHAYNINADTAAAEIASAMRAEKLILLTDVDGVRAGPDAEEPLYVLTAAEVHDFIAKGVISKGMIPKALGCLAALDAGVGRTHIIDGRVPHCILLEIFTNRGIGTMILKSKVPYYMAERL